MDEVAQAVEDVKRTWDQTVVQIEDHIKEIQSCGKSGKGIQEVNSLPRLNSAAQDGLALLRSLQFRFDLLAQQLPTEEVVSALAVLSSWKEQYLGLHSSLRNANLQAKNNIREAAQEERELLLGGGEESTIRRRNLQTKAGMTSAAESITESLRRTRQLMVQVIVDDFEVSTDLMVFDLYLICSQVYRRWKEESTGVLKKAESEYKGQRSLLMHTRRLLTTMQRQDVMDRVIMVAGFLIFISAVFYVVSKRIGLLALQRKIVTAIKSGSMGHDDVGKELSKSINKDHLSTGQPNIFLHFSRIWLSVSVMTNFGLGYSALMVKKMSFA
ncbi:hypothetical protein IEQ34_005342 [Dendrobium chrysotoxum]|uniref:Sec20 C-terminal domain-containing protein n=1 Tax=Dendrobium chrysotoxum TaxID=161865 RepID=A0AAV7GUS4_DENCH|nr:hypothetical protein IEQ34_005342 [Dendrobium chrysotoxum]